MLKHLNRELILKCKVPSGDTCESDNECAKLNRCMYGKCKGFEGAFCVKDDDCYKSTTGSEDNTYFCMPDYRDFDDDKKTFDKNSEEFA